MGKPSREKGQRGEREFAQLLVAKGFQAKRGGHTQTQDGGGVDNQDVIHDVPGVLFEVKRTEALNFYAAFRQARTDADGKLTPVVTHKRNREEPMVYTTADHYLDLHVEIRRLRGLVEALEVVSE